MGLFAEGIRYGERAQKIAESYPADQYLFFKSLYGLCFIYLYMGDTPRVFEGAKRLLEYGKKSSNSRSTVFGYWMRAWGHWSSGDMNLSQEYSVKAMESAMDPFYHHFPKISLGFSYLFGGQIEEAENTLLSAIEFADKRGIGTISHACECFLAPTLIAKGQMSQGMKLMEKVQKTLILNKRRVLYALSEYIIGEVYSQIATGPRPSLSILVKNVGFLVKNAPFAAKKAEFHFNRAVELFEEIGAKSYNGLVYLSMGMLYKARRRSHQARQCLQEAIKIFQEYGADGYLIQANEALESLE
jgi:tetratricopeptide (TPR) repeat protein